jgi:ferredoxin-NADP reductase|tara:strand:- start:34 stop:768 length:735 start_codon:yes stop_codon:yes gene_type:complete
MQTLNLKVTELIELSPTSKAIRLGLKGKKFDYQPGQFVTFELDLTATGKFKVLEGKPSTQKRRFSLSSLPSNPYLEVTVRKTDDGFVSDYLVNYSTLGEEIAVKGPYGHFFLDEKNSKKNIFLIGMGSGICPLISILRYIKEKELPIQVHYLCSARFENEIIWRKEIESLPSENITYEFTITREEPKNWKGSLGRINKDLISKNLKDPKNTEFYLCGSPEFVENITSILKELKIPKENIKKEAY